MTETNLLIGLDELEVSDELCKSLIEQTTGNMIKTRIMICEVSLIEWFIMRGKITQKKENVQVNIHQLFLGIPKFFAVTSKFIAHVLINLMY